MNVWRRFGRDRTARAIVAGYAVALLLHHLGHRLPTPLPGRDPDLWVALGVLLESPALHFARAGLMGFLLVLWGIGRVQDTHPAMPTWYGRWLATTPWRWGQPLPNGSPFLGIVDVLIVGVLTAVSIADLGWSPWTASALFVGAYTATAMVVAIGEPMVFIACLILAPLLVYPHFDLRWTMVVLAALWALMTWAGFRLLRRFPFQADDWRERGPTPQGAGLPKLEYPHGTLGPGAVPASEAVWVKAMVIGLGVWWLHAAAATLIYWDGTLDWRKVAAGITGAGPEAQLSGLWELFVLVVAGGRWLVYRTQVAPPLALPGRVLTGRWLILGYDRFWIGPLVTLLVGAWAPTALRTVGLPDVLVPATSVGLVLLTAWSAWPSLENWQLTGPGRVQKRWRAQPQKQRRQTKSSALNENVEINFTLFARR